MNILFVMSTMMSILMYQNNSKHKHQINLKALLVTFLFSRGLNEYGK